MRLVELSRSAHAGLRIRPDRAEAAAAGQHLIPIVASEFRKAATQFPIVFVKSPETGHFGPCVLTGLDVEENLFWSGTELEAAYVPLNVRRLPFYVGTDAGSSVLCIDVDSPCVDVSGQKGIVNSDGTDSAYLKEILSILGELVVGKERTGQFIAAALSLDLLAPIMLDITLDDRTPLRLAGLYGLDEERFRQLNEREIAGLWQAGHLDLVYSALIATGQIFNLIRLKNQRITAGRAWHSNSG
jgi:SapC